MAFIAQQPARSYVSSVPIQFEPAWPQPWGIWSAPVYSQVYVPQQQNGPISHYAPVYTGAMPSVYAPQLVHAAPYWIPGAPVNHNASPGVADVDYDFEVMVRFLSQMAHGMLVGEDTGFWSAPHREQLRVFVSQTLLATRPQLSTVLLALTYLRTRPGGFKAGFVCHYLVVALMLANKMNDDNTFTNSSWSQATGLPLEDITQLELEWLKEVDWTLNATGHLTDHYDRWGQCWAVFCSSQRPPTPVLSGRPWSPGFVPMAVSAF